MAGLISGLGLKAKMKFKEEQASEVLGTVNRVSEFCSTRQALLQVEANSFFFVGAQQPSFEAQSVSNLVGGSQTTPLSHWSAADCV